MSEPQVFGLCGANCKYPVYTQQQIISILQQLLENGSLDGVNPDIQTSAEYVLEQQNKRNLSFWLGTESQYNSLSPVPRVSLIMARIDENGMMYLCTDDSTLQAWKESTLVECKQQTDGALTSIQEHNHDDVYAAKTHNHDTSYAAKAHDHTYLKQKWFIEAYYDNALTDGSVSISMCDYFFFSEGSSGVNPTISMLRELPMFFQAWGITGEDFYFNGDVRIDGDIYGKPAIVSSDRREKHDIKDLDGKYSALFQKLRPVTFVYNDGHRNHLGFIAQEVEQSISEVGLSTDEFAGFVRLPIFGKKEITETTTDENGDMQEKTHTVVDKENVIDYKLKLRYEEFIALCVDEIQKLQKRVEKLEGVYK